MTKREVLDAAARGEGCLGRSQDDEPVFVVCARDLLSTQTVLKWEALAEASGVSYEKRKGAIQDAADMTTWRNAHGGGKIPD